MEKPILTNSLRYTRGNGAIQKQRNAEQLNKIAEPYSYDFARDTVNLLSRALWWSAPTTSSDNLNLKGLQIACNRIRHKTLAIEKRLKTTTANDILATVGQNLWSNGDASDDALPSFEKRTQVYGYGEPEVNVTSCCSPQSRLHNWLEPEKLSDADNNQNALINKKEECVRWDDMKAVGYGRKHTPEILTYRNPFDPRITFDGVRDWFPPPGARTFERDRPASVERIRDARITHYDIYLNEYHKYIKSLYDCGRYYSRSRPPSEHGEPRHTKTSPSECITYATTEEKQLAERVFSAGVKDLWSRDAKTYSQCVKDETGRGDAQREGPHPRDRPLHRQRLPPNDLRNRPMQPCPESWRPNKPAQGPTASGNQNGSDSDTKARDIPRKRQLPELPPKIASKFAAATAARSPADKDDGALVWWRESNTDPKHSDKPYTFPDAFGFAPAKSSVVFKMPKVGKTDTGGTSSSSYADSAADDNEKKIENDWFKELMEASGLTSFIDLTKDHKVDVPSWNAVHADTSPYPDIWEDACTPESVVTVVSSCPLPLKTPVTTATPTGPDTITTTTNSCPRFSVSEAPSSRCGEASLSGRQGAPGLGVQPPRPGSKSDRINEVNIQQLFQAAQAGCHTVISRAMFPYTCFYNQRPPFMPPTPPPLIWQSCAVNPLVDFRPPPHGPGRATPPADPPFTSTSVTPTSSTPTTSSFGGHESTRLTGATDVRHRQSPNVWLKDDTRRQSGDAPHDRNPDPLHPTPPTTIPRNGGLCIPVAFNLGRPSPAPLAAPIAPCFTTRPAIQILGTNPPPFGPSFPALYRTNCTMKNNNKNNSGIDAAELCGEEMVDERGMMIHAIPDMCAGPISVQPTLSAMQANIIQIFPTKIVYS